MKINAVAYDDSEEIVAITMTMTLPEAAAIHAIAGRLNSFGYDNLGLRDESLYDALSRVFNGHYESGRPPSAPRIKLESLNAPSNQEDDR